METFNSLLLVVLSEIIILWGFVESMQKVVMLQLPATLHSRDIRLTTFESKIPKAWKCQYKNTSTFGGLRFDIAFVFCKANISVVPAFTFYVSRIVVFSESIHAYKRSKVQTAQSEIVVFECVCVCRK